MSRPSLLSRPTSVFYQTVAPRSPFLMIMISALSRRRIAAAQPTLGPSPARRASSTAPPTLAVLNPSRRQRALQAGMLTMTASPTGGMARLVVLDTQLSKVISTSWQILTPTCLPPSPLLSTSLPSLQASTRLHSPYRGPLRALQVLAGLRSHTLPDLLPESTTSTISPLIVKVAPGLGDTALPSMPVPIKLREECCYLLSSGGYLFIRVGRCNMKVTSS